MEFDDIKNLSLPELEILLAAKFKSLHLLNVMEDEILESGISHRELITTRDQILDDILMIQALLKKLNYDAG
ncbi:MAG: hypothetical protein IPM81_03000 [Saprospirales bacterium]|nr:hypothetical protein [Saprospirales bacterium]